MLRGYIESGLRTALVANRIDGRWLRFLTAIGHIN